ncbi:PREDICTED: major facilitator superfamily domain-containing protein 1-like [Priapulus caudatus]|uniref:Lysosomal dipeptide transporter MFSD1 n=1 Tax=Priapulus caudatus TaxID=37621 RepID=A0ABM1ECI6_PRICU|nr:PREDICTED: major facilitator superfamily domain-containing protein 1-like [Priapulus caudatus]
MPETEPLLVSSPSRDYGSDGGASPNKRRVSAVRSVDPSQLEIPGCGGTLCCHPGRWMHRFIMLVLMCLLGFGSYFCYDNPSALQDDMKRDLRVSTSEFMSLYSWYSWPNVVLCFFGGFMLDSVFGIRVGTVVFALFVLFGQLVFALGAFLDKFWLMQAGRFLFGTGGESLAVAQNTYAVTWFKGKELNMVFGLQLSIARVGSTANMNLMGPVYDLVGRVFDLDGYEQLGIALFFAAATCVMTLICALLLGFFDHRANRILRLDEGKTAEAIHITDVKDFGLAFWMLCIICVSFYVAIFPFIGLGVMFFESKFGFTKSNALAVNGIVYIISAVASPLLGFMVDRVGRNITWVIIAIVVTMGCHATMAFTFLNPFIAMSVMGISYSLLASALWPTVAYVIADHQLGTAYGIMQAIQNLGLAVIALVCGSVVDNNGYLILEVFFLGWLALALVAAVLLYLIDSGRGLNLNLSATGRAQMVEELEREERAKEEALGDYAQTADLLRPRSNFYFRNRYLSRLGAKLPEHYNIYTSALVRRSLLQ